MEEIKYEEDILVALSAEASRKLQVMANSVYTTYSKCKISINKQETKAMKIGNYEGSLNISTNEERTGEFL